MRESLLTILRDEKTATGNFRQAAHQLAHILAADITALVNEKPKAVQTPLGKAQGKTIDQRVVLIPILRAGLTLLPAFQKFFPDAPIGFFGIRRDETTALPQLYYEHLPDMRPTDLILLLDPMIATGGSAMLAIEHIAKKGVPPSQIVLAGIVGSVEGIKKIKNAHEHLKVIIIGEDPALNDRKFIVPGLGDFGDRYFGN